MRYSPIYLKGGFIKLCEEFYLDFNGNISELCKIAKLPLVTYYSWLSTDSNFRDTMRLFEDAMKDKARSSLSALINDENAPWKYKLQAYQILYPEPKDDVSDSDQSFSLNIQYNGQPI